VAAVKQALAVNVEFFKFCSSGNSRRALKAISQLFELEKTFHIPFLRKKTTLYDGFEMVIGTKATLPKATGYIREVCEIFASITHPKDSKSVEYEKYRKSPISHENYLM